MSSERTDYEKAYLNLKEEKYPKYLSDSTKTTIFDVWDIGGLKTLLKELIASPQKYVLSDGQINTITQLDKNLRFDIDQLRNAISYQEDERKLRLRIDGYFSSVFDQLANVFPLTHDNILTTGPLPLQDGTENRSPSENEEISPKYAPEVRNCALIVDVCHYANTDIPDFTAERKTSEIRDVLENNSRGKFEKVLYLTGPDATLRQIQEMLSNAFRREINYDLVLFHFVGYCFDGLGEEMYLGTTDIDIKDPYISGLDLKSLKEIVSYSSNRSKNVVMIFDCCYGRKFHDPEAEWTDKVDSMFAHSLERLSGSNRSIIGSCEITGGSQSNYSSTNMYACGDITVSIGDILSGRVSDEFGIATITRIRKELEDSIKGNIAFFPQNLGESEDFQILVTGEYENRIKSMLNDIEDKCKRWSDALESMDAAGKGKGMYYDGELYVVRDIARRLIRLSLLEGKNEIIMGIAGRAKGIIDKYLTMIRIDIESWLKVEGYEVKEELTKASGNDKLYDQFRDTAKYLSFDEIVKHEYELKKVAIARLNALILFVYNVDKKSIFLYRIRINKPNKPTQTVSHPAQSGPKRSSDLGLGVAK